MMYGSIQSILYDAAWCMVRFRGCCMMYGSIQSILSDTVWCMVRFRVQCVMLCMWHAFLTGLQRKWLHKVGTDRHQTSAGTQLHMAYSYCLQPTQCPQDHSRSTLCMCSLSPASACWIVCSGNFGPPVLNAWQERQWCKFPCTCTSKLLCWPICSHLTCTIKSRSFSMLEWWDLVHQELWKPSPCLSFALCIQITIYELPTSTSPHIMTT